MLPINAFKRIYIPAFETGPVYIAVTSEQAILFVVIINQC